MIYVTSKVQILLGQKRYFSLLLQRKSTYLKRTSEILRAQHDDDIPGDVDGLCALPGVGPKMAHLTMNIAWKKQSGIGEET